MKPACPKCRTIHPSNAAIAYGRFRPEGSLGYVATYPDAPIRPTRAEAEADYCKHIQEKP